MSWRMTEENDWDSQGLGTMLEDEPPRLFKLKKDNKDLVVGSTSLGWRPSTSLPPGRLQISEMTAPDSVAE